MGWTGAAIPEDYGGAGLGHLGSVRAGRGAGLARWRRCRSRPRSTSRARPSSPAAARRRRRAWLPRLASGEIIGTLALAEGPGKADVRKLRTAFRNGVLSGDKLPVPDGDVADVAVVVAQGERGPVLPSPT